MNLKAENDRVIYSHEYVIWQAAWFFLMEKNDYTSLMPLLFITILTFLTNICLTYLGSGNSSLWLQSNQFLTYYFIKAYSPWWPKRQSHLIDQVRL